MSLSLNEQLHVFLIMLAYGACASLIFDIFRSIYRTFKPSAVTVGIGDIFFWLIISVCTFYVFFITTNGQIRIFEFIAMILGSIFYFLIFSRPVIFILSHIFGIFKKIFSVIFKILLTILVFLYKMINRIIVCIFMPIIKITKKIKRLFSILLYKFKTGLYCFLKNKRKIRKRGKVAHEKKHKRKKK